MVKMVAGAVVFAAALFLVLPSTSAVRKINSISDLRRIAFHTSVSRQTIVLLHWFANTVDINNGVIYITFNQQGDYGSHHYGNFDSLLNDLPTGYNYYTVGNIHEDKRRQLPSHIHNLQTTDDDGNRARIIFRVHERSFRQQGTRQVVDEVYITQHHRHAGIEYDPQRTYQISLNLLRQIREFPMRGNYNLLRSLRQQYEPNVEDYQLTHIQYNWKDLACLGLLLFIVVQSTPSNTRQSGWSQPQTDSDLQACCLVFILVVFMIVVGAFLINKT